VIDEVAVAEQLRRGRTAVSIIISNQRERSNFDSENKTRRCSAAASRSKSSRVQLDLSVDTAKAAAPTTDILGIRNHFVTANLG